MLLIGKEYSDELWYGNEDDPDDTGIVYKQIFPYLYIDETQTEVKAYICYEVDIPDVQSKTIKGMKITIWCICHKSCMKCSKRDYLGTRADKLADAVERALRNYEFQQESKGKAAYGIGKLQLKSVLNFSSVNKEFYGRQLIFSVPEFKIRGA